MPKKYGLCQTIADTLGIGGIMRALRTIGLLFKVLQWNALIAFLLALFITWVIKFAFMDSYILCQTMASYMAVAPNTQITYDLYSKLSGISSSFKKLYNEGEKEGPRPNAQPQNSQAPVNQAQPQYNQQPYSPPPPQQTTYTPPPLPREILDSDVKGTKYEAISTWGYIGIMLLMCIPVVGALLVIIWACGGAESSVKKLWQEQP